ncbi:MAG: L,D-transpeptidase [Hyphomicrobiaceae bacterium]
MRSCVLATALAVGLGFASAGATDQVASAGETPPSSPPVTTIGKTLVDDKPVDTPATATEPDAAKSVADKPKPPAPPSLIVKVNLSTQRLDVITGGATVHSWPISSGRAGFETPRGTFRAQWAAKMWYSKKYDLAPMPHSVFINGGVAIHATSSTGMLGRPASHGCIRLAPANAATFYSLVHKHGLKQTQVQVFGTPPAPRVAEVRSRRLDGPPLRTAGQVSGQFSGPVPGQRPGVVHLRPGSPHYGAQSFEHNGIRYVRIR